MSAKDVLCTWERDSSNRGLKTFWKALQLTIEFRTEGRKVAGFDNLTSFPKDEPSESEFNNNNSD